MMKRKNAYSEEQMNWLRKNIPVLGIAKGYKQYNSTFNQNRTYDAIRTMCVKNKIKCSKGIMSKRGRDNAKKYLEIGTITEDSQGYLHIKINNKRENRQGNWKLYHRYIYEKEYGPIPKNSYLMFLDGNRKNCTITNLKLVPQPYITLMMKYNLRSETAEITETAIK